MYRFIVCELQTGKVLQELPMVIEGDLTRALRQYGEGTLAVPLYNSQGTLVSANWENEILPWRSHILVTDMDRNILWTGIPETRLRNLSNTAVRLPCVTPEAYFIHAYVPGLAFHGKDQTSEIFVGLMQVAGAEIGLEYNCPASGVLRDRSYADDEQARVYDRVNELAATDQGFDWTIDVVWGDADKTYVRKIARTGYPYLGNRTATPAHVFEQGANLADLSYEESWAEGDAATHVRAVGDGEGSSKVMSDPVVDTVREANGWPRLEARKSFSGVTDKATADAHARAVAAQMFGGQQMAEVVARLPMPGEHFTSLADITLGDTARVKCTAAHLTMDQVWPVVGWSLNAGTGTYKPFLARIGDD